MDAKQVDFTARRRLARICAAHLLRLLHRSFPLLALARSLHLSRASSSRFARLCLQRSLFPSNIVSRVCLPMTSDERGAIVENLEPETPAGSFSCKIVKRASAFPCFREDRYPSSFRLIDGSAVTGG